jgi:anaphase-promoting complex subunit 8
VPNVAYISPRNGTCPGTPSITLTQPRAAELLNSLPIRETDKSDDVDFDSSATFPPSKLPNPEQQHLEAREYHKYLLAKSFFDCREYDRCAAVFLTGSRPRVPGHTPPQTTPSRTRSSKGKEKIPPPDEPIIQAHDLLSRWSHKSLFLAIYAKYLAGEKRRDEESEMILGPADGGMTVNKELPGLIQLLGDWLKARAARNKNSGGWLEYLYGILLAKNKSENQAKEWFLQSIHLCPFNWGAWQELSNLIRTTDEVCHTPIPFESHANTASSREP